MSVEIYFSNLDNETKLEVLNENRIEYFSFDEFITQANSIARESYGNYLNRTADSYLNSDVVPLAIYESDPSVFEDE